MHKWHCTQKHFLIGGQRTCLFVIGTLLKIVFLQGKIVVEQKCENFKYLDFKAVRFLIKILVCTVMTFSGCSWIASFFWKSEDLKCVKNLIVFQFLFRNSTLMTTFTLFSSNICLCVVFYHFFTSNVYITVSEKFESQERHTDYFCWSMLMYIFVYFSEACSHLNIAWSYSSWVVKKRCFMISSDKI